MHVLVAKSNVSGQETTCHGGSGASTPDGLVCAACDQVATGRFCHDDDIDDDDAAMCGGTCDAWQEVHRLYPQDMNLEQAFDIKGSGMCMPMVRAIALQFLTPRDFYGRVVVYSIGVDTVEPAGNGGIDSQSDAASGDADGVARSASNVTHTSHDHDTGSEDDSEYDHDADDTDDTDDTDDGSGDTYGL